MWPWILLGGLPVGAAVALLTWRPLKRFGKGVQVERARELFMLQRERLDDLDLAEVRQGDVTGVASEQSALHDATLVRDDQVGAFHPPGPQDEADQPPAAQAGADERRQDGAVRPPQDRPDHASDDHDQGTG